MGMGLGRSSSCKYDRPETKTVYVQVPCKNKVLPNPNKYRWRIKDFFRFKNDWCVLRIQYTDCINYEGSKILVYDSFEKFDKLRRTGAIDPHFDDSSYSPTARFEPTKTGLSYAMKFARNRKKV